MKNLFKNLVAIFIGFLFAFFIVEVVFRTILPASQMPFGTYDNHHMIAKFDNDYINHGQFTIGKLCKLGGKWSVNNEGWMSDIDYSKNKSKPRIAVIGDSYIEAFQVDADKNVASVLRKMLNNSTDVFSFGVSGAPMSQYFQIAKYVNKEFNPDIFVFNIVHNDFDESLCKVKTVPSCLCLEQNDGSIGFNRPIVGPEAKTMTKVLSKSAIFRYLIYNLKILSGGNPFGKRGEVKTFNANVDVEKVAALKDEISKGIDFIFNKITVTFPGKRIIFMIDGIRHDIYKNIPFDGSNVSWMNSLIVRLGEKYSFDVIDLTTPFTQDYNENRIHFESEWDWHWNEYGHRIAARSLYTILISKQDRQKLKTTEPILPRS